MNPLTSTQSTVYEPSHGRSPPGRPTTISPFPAESRNGSTPMSISQRMTSCALPKTELFGDELRSAALRSTDNDDDECKTYLSAVKLHISTQRYSRERRGNDTRKYGRDNEANQYPDYCEKTCHESSRGTITVAVWGKGIDEFLSIFSIITLMIIENRAL